MIDDNRIHALELAVREHDRLGAFVLRPGEDAGVTTARLETAIRTSADVFLAWLRGPVRLEVTFGPIVNHTTLAPTGAATVGENMAQLHDNEQVDVTVRPKDGKGFESADALVYAVADETVCTVVGATDDDSHTATIVAGVPGSTVVTVTDPTAIDSATGAALSATIAIDVVPGGAVLLDVTVGTPVEQPPAV